MEWPLSEEHEDVFRTELGERAWSWAQDVNEFEENELEDVEAYVPSLSLRSEAERLATSERGSAMIGFLAVSAFFVVVASGFADLVARLVTLR